MTVPSIRTHKNTRNAPVCTYYLRNACIRGETCQYSHEVENTFDSSEVISAPLTRKTNVCQHFLRGTCRWGDSCKGLHPEPINGTVREAVEEVAITDSVLDDAYVLTKNRVWTRADGPRNTGAKPCLFFIQGRCSKGELCPFLHSFGSEPSISSEVQTNTTDHLLIAQNPPAPDRTVVGSADPQTCKFFAKGCKNGDSCPYLHPTTSPLPSPPFVEVQMLPENPKSIPISEATLSASAPSFQPCLFFITGSCSKGEACISTHGLAEIGSQAEPLSDALNPNDSEISAHGFPSNEVIPADSDFSEAWEYNDEPTNLDTPFTTVGQGAELNWFECAPLIDAHSFLGRPCKFFAEGRCKSGPSCRFRHDFPETDYIGEQPAQVTRAPAENDNDTTWADPSKNRRSNGICKFFSRSSYCAKGDSCRFRHEAAELQDSWDSGQRNQDRWVSSEFSSSDAERVTAPCKYFIQGHCKSGDLCKYQHESPGSQDSLNVYPEINNDWGAPLEDPRLIKKGEKSYKPCEYFAQGDCRRGDSCLFTHDIQTVDSGMPHIHEGNLSPTQAWPSVDGDDPWSTPEPKTESYSKICAFFLQGYCKKGDSCPRDHNASTQGVVHAVGSESSHNEDNGWSPFHQEDPWSTKEAEKGSRLCKYFVQGDCRKGDSCLFVHDIQAIDSEIPRTNESGLSPTQGWPSVDGDDPWSSSKPKSEICTFFLQGHCKKGDSCIRDHDISTQGAVHAVDSEPSHTKDNDGRPPVDQDDPWLIKKAEKSPKPCRYFVQGNCWRGDSCLFTHDIQTIDNGMPHMHEEWPSVGDDDPWSTPEPKTGSHSGPCTFFLQGHCKKGDSCPRDHNEPSQGLVHAVNLEPTHAEDNDGTWSVPWSVEPEQQSDIPPSTTPSPETPAEALISIERTLFNCRVDFGTGTYPLQITTPFESRHSIIHNFPLDVTESEVIELVEPFGQLTSVVLELLPSSVNARLEFLECSQAGLAVQALNNIEYRSARLGARLDLRSLVNTGAGTLLNRKVKISWYAPTLVAWAHYKSIRVAKEQAEKLNDSIFQGRKIKALFEKPRRGTTHSFTVKLKGLPLRFDNAALEIFCGNSDNLTLLTMGAPSYDAELPLDQIRTLLTGFGPLDSFEVLPLDEGKTKRMAFAQYSTGESAAAAAKNLHGAQQAFLGSSPIWIQQIYAVKYSIPARQFTTIQDALNQLRDDYDKECKVRYYNLDAHGQSVDPVCIRLYAEEAKSLGRVKAKVERLLKGDPLAWKTKEVWDDYFGSSGGAELFENVNTDSTVFVRCDPRMRTVRLFGNAPAQKNATRVILLHLKEVRARRHIIPLEKSALRALLHGGLKDMHNEFGRERVMFNAVDRSLVVRGDEDDIRRIRRAIASFDSSSTLASAGEALCPVCFCGVTDPLALFCGHVYCRLCLQHLLRSTITAAFNIPRCVAEVDDEITNKSRVQCNSDIPYAVVRELLSSAEEKNLLESSFLSHIHSRPDEFRYCPTPDCTVIYRPAKMGTILLCPSCLVQICAACHVEYHEGLTCAEHVDNLTGGHEALSKWRSENGIKPCPNCHADLEKDGGCNHVKCIRCSTHMCWVCMKTFSDGGADGGVYKHMSDVHGGIY